ncbi:MAG: hypothetical protein AB8X85_01490 [Coxiella endosymbiont of Dermacentor silvarum]
MENIVSALDNLSAVRVVTISTESDGRIAGIHFKSGQGGGPRNSNCETG